MAHQDLAIESLGVIHKKYNKKVRDVIAENKTLDETEFQPGKNDLDNLIKIDIASNKKDVDYILSVLKSRDMLYVSRALNNSKWLVENSYEHIINPGNVRDQLFPHMTTVAGIKLTKFIRQHLKDETRVQEFLKSETDPKRAAKWLSRCSVAFIEEHVKYYLQHMNQVELKRILEKSPTIFDAATKDNEYCRNILQAAIFLVKTTHLENYLDVVERVPMPRYDRPIFNAKATDTIMGKVAERIKNKFNVYIRMIHLPTFVKYLKKEEVKDFLYKQIGDDSFNPHSYEVRRLFKFPIMKIFVSRMPKEEQFSFVKNNFIDKCVLQLDEKTVEPGTEMYALRNICVEVCRNSPSYVWYEFAPFQVAFTEIKKLIENQSTSYDKYSMLEVLLICAAGNVEHIQSVLSYYHDKHRNDEVHQKNEFISKLETVTNILKYDEATWILLDKILVSMDVYLKSDNTEHKCVEVAILYNILQNRPMPKILGEKIKIFKNATFKKYQNKLGKNDGNKLFAYLHDYAKTELENVNINNQETFDEAIAWLDFLMNLLFDWHKALTDYPIILEKIKYFIKIKKDNDWKLDLAKLYNKNKAWRKNMFEESLIMAPSQDVCVNAIKHEPELLGRYREQVESISFNDTASLTKLLKKLRIYWSNSLADEWSKLYIARLNTLGNHKAVIRGICTILPQDELEIVIKKYAPEQAKIDWGKTDELTLSLQRMIAKNMHIARPQPSADAILLYAKGDFLQYALPSLLSIYYNLGRVVSKEHIPKLLNAPVSLQKHGLRLSFDKLDHDELKHHMSNLWKTSKNSSIRAVIFKLMFELLRKEKNDSKAQELWELMEVFINNLNFHEDEKIYKLLPLVSEVPLIVRPSFLIKSLKFLKSLIQDTKKDRKGFQYDVDRLEEYIREVMEFMNPEYVAEILTNYIDEKFYKVSYKYSSDVRSSVGMVPVLCAYLLCTKDEDVQMQRYEELLAPLIRRSLDMWNESREGSYFMRGHLQEVLKGLLYDLEKFVIAKEMLMPTKMLMKIQYELRDLPVSENYVMLTMWKLTVKLSELIEKTCLAKNYCWDDICPEIAPEFGKFCLTCLKEDVSAHFSCIYILFTKSLEMTTRNSFPVGVKLQIYEHLVSDADCVQAYLAALKLYPKGTCNEDEEKALLLKEIIHKHPSIEVKMHYYNHFKMYNR